MTLNRRQLFRLVGAGAALSSLGTTAAVAAQPKFVEPTAQKPMLLCFNENRLSMADPRARKWLMDQIEAHFFGEGVAHPEGYVAPENKTE